VGCAAFRRVGCRGDRGRGVVVPGEQADDRHDAHGERRRSDALGDRRATRAAACGDVDDGLSGSGRLGGSAARSRALHRRLPVKENRRAANSNSSRSQLGCRDERGIARELVGDRSGHGIRACRRRRGERPRRHVDRGRVLGGDRFARPARRGATPTEASSGCARRRSRRRSPRRRRRRPTRRGRLSGGRLGGLGGRGLAGASGCATSATAAEAPGKRLRGRRGAAWAARRRYSARVSAPGPVGVAADSVRRLARREGVASAAGCRGQITQALVRPRGRGRRRRTTGFGSLRRSGRQR
jgi:hypothetical protein